MSSKLFTASLYRIIFPMASRKLFSEEDIRFKSSRSGGPGGQNVNKRSTRVQLWLPISALLVSEAERERVRKKLANRMTQKDEIEIECDEERSQEANRLRAVGMLRDLVLEALKVPKKRIPTKISMTAEAKFREEKKKESEKKQLRKFLPKEWLDGE